MVVHTLERICRIGFLALVLMLPPTLKLRFEENKRCIENKSKKHATLMPKPLVF